MAVSYAEKEELAASSDMEAEEIAATSDTLKEENLVAPDMENQEVMLTSDIENDKEAVDSDMDKEKGTDRTDAGKPYNAEMFFLSFYVAANIQTSNILFQSPTSEGLLYFVGIWSSLIPLWLEKTCYQSCSVYGEGFWHRSVEVGMLLVLGTAVVHIRPVEVLSNPAENVDMFVFCLAMVLLAILSTLRYVSVFWFGGNKQNLNRGSAAIYIQGRCLSSMAYLAAAVLAGLDFYGPKINREIYSNTAILLCLSGSIIWFLHLFLCMCLCKCTYRIARRPNDTAIFWNVDSYLECLDEWTMMMLGTSAITILVEGIPYEHGSYLTFYSIMVMLILLQLLHFRSQSYTDDRCAMKRSALAATTWSTLYQVYSGALLVIGVSCRLMLYTLALEVEGEDRRVLMGENQNDSLLTPWFLGHQALEVSQADLQQRAADLFCFSIATVMFCLDCMILVSNGYKNFMRRCMVKNDNVYRWREKSFVLIFFRLSVIIIIATLSQYEKNPVVLALVGLLFLIFQLFFRNLFDFFFPQHTECSDEPPTGFETLVVGTGVQTFDEASLEQKVGKSSGELSFDIEGGFSSGVLNSNTSGMANSTDSTASESHEPSLKGEEDFTFEEASLKGREDFMLENLNDMYCQPFPKDSEYYYAQTDEDESALQVHYDASGLSDETEASEETVGLEGVEIDHVVETEVKNDRNCEVTDKITAKETFPEDYVEYEKGGSCHPTGISTSKAGLAEDSGRKKEDSSCSERIGASKQSIDKESASNQGDAEKQTVACSPDKVPVEKEENNEECKGTSMSASDLSASAIGLATMESIHTPEKGVVPKEVKSENARQPKKQMPDQRVRFSLSTTAEEIEVLSMATMEEAPREVWRI